MLLPPVGTSEEKLSTDITCIVSPNYQLICVTLKFPLDSGDRVAAAEAPTAPSPGLWLRISALKPDVRSTQYLYIEKKTTSLWREV